MHHFEQDRLDTDLKYRFDYLCKFMNFGEKDIAVIKGSASAIAPLVPTIVNAVYDKLFQFDITMAYFTEKNHGFDGNVEKNVKEIDVYNSAQIKFRKDMLSKYLVKLVTAQYDIHFVKYLDWVGKIHTNKAGAKSINVEYVHCNALFGFVHDYLLTAIAGLGLPHDDMTAAISAFTKLLWIQNDLFARHYVPTKAEQKAIDDALALAKQGPKQPDTVHNILNYAFVIGVTAITCAILMKKL